MQRMKQQSFQFQFEEYQRLEELSESQSQLVALAIEAARMAYAPYSSYLVGAALRLQDDTVITGNNQENAAYPSGLCAERVALFYAGARYPEQAVTSMAVVAFKDGSLQSAPVSPCGGCRQVMLEKESQGNKAIEVILYGSERIWVINSAKDLLPFPFSIDLK
jgi:cytidine deaminase